MSAALAEVVSIRLSKWAVGIPYPLLFVAGAAFGILFASLFVLCTHSARTAKSTTDMFGPAPVAVAPPVGKWQPNVIVIRPAAPDPMFDTPATIEPAAIRPATAPAAAPVAKKAVTRNAVRRHATTKQGASGDLLTAAL